ncbi:FKBP-type peptidyl-prolyl cis-trans isomerase [Pedobacter helvus]|uniref:Peptidyl-prolyl cis-trans isomerase n=1 Tax=Pedobacter helvus TaxID=2563444 RepID=A0ABW9JNG1_9SPHI|nr:FKBP-type peptidyl-prolyl cis-trans isomerase [Pedobacter ureilyticus]
MKLKTKFLLILVAVITVVSSCSKDDYDAEKQLAVDDALIVDFIAKNNIPAIKHSSGLYYQIITPGDGASVTAASTVGVVYTGKLLNGTQFDQATNTVSFRLSGVIPGWTIGVPLIKVGGRIRLIIPSTLAYGNESPGAGIPKNAVLDFTIDLHNAQ